ncbi:hypothetical protein E2C01_058430 [Portunus trituberculatus]|uniref:Uncharacterized protein n=1 Tax=Portunus trituberculatus TaxID=210409 RepID=A0A5B7H5C1_PORTR|nr:hypothetical protein [Portunus trituberculatus]
MVSMLVRVDGNPGGPGLPTRTGERRIYNIFRVYISSFHRSDALCQTDRRYKGQSALLLLSTWGSSESL